MAGLKIPGNATPEEFEQLLLARLGLPPTASPEQIDDAHEAVIGFLASAPRDVRAWARVQASVADEAYALLSDPAAFERSRALVERASRPASAPGGPATPPARRDSPAQPARRSPTPGTTPPAKAAPSGSAPSHTADDPAELTNDELAELVAAVTPSAHRDSTRQPAPRTAIHTRAPVRRSAWPLPTRRVGLLAVAAVAAVAIAAGGYNLGGGAPVATPAANAAATTPALDQALVTGLMERIQANPNDTDALMRLGDAFFQAKQYQTSADWLKRLVAIDSKNIQGLLALGAAYFNLGDSTNAETTWKQVTALEPDNVEAHYDLGFLYLYAEPPDIAGVEREWAEVVRLAPDSQVARTVQAHLATLPTPAPGSPAPSAGPSSAAPTSGPSPSPASSAPTESAAPAGGTPVPSAAPSGTTPGAQASP